MTINRKILLVIFCCLVAMFTCRDKDDVPAYENISQSTGKSVTPTIAAGNNGQVYVVWDDSISSQDYEIFFSEMSSNGTWSQGINISNNSTVSAVPFVDVDNLGNIHVCWWDFVYEGPDNRILYRMRKPDGSWDSIEVLAHTSSSDSVYNLPRIVCDINNNVYVMWHGYVGGATLHYRIKNSNGDWSEIMVVASFGFGATNPARLATDLQENLHITYEGTNSIHYQMRMANGDWQNFATIDQGSSMPFVPDIALDGSGIVHIAWSARDNFDYYIYYTNNKTGNWAESEKLPMKKPNDVGFYSAIDVEDDGTLHFVWENWTEDTTTGEYGEADIYYARRYPDGDWSDVHNISNTIARSLPAMIAVDDLGNAHIVWADNELGNFEVFYLKIPYDSL